jgi:hypothetical protein
MGIKTKNNTASDKSSVVKIDASLLEKIEEFIRKDENKLKFVNKKQFVDLAIFNFLKEQGGKLNG